MGINLRQRNKIISTGGTGDKGCLKNEGYFFLLLSIWTTLYPQYTKQENTLRNAVPSVIYNSLFNQLVPMGSASQSGWNTAIKKNPKMKVLYCIFMNCVTILHIL